MKIGLYQFASTNRIEDNLSKICNAAEQAVHMGVRLLVFHECALCGYPPIESQINDIKKDNIDAALNEISSCAKQCKLYLAVGTIRFESTHKYNSILLFDDEGKVKGCYDKTALWGWDTENFTRGTKPGVFVIDGIRIGFRICFDIRFPESFRELYKQNTEICFVCFSDVSTVPSPNRYDIIKAHLITRAAENVMSIASVNSISNYQTAPTAFIDCNGGIISEAEINTEQFLIWEFTKPELSFGSKGRIENNHYFLGSHSGLQ